MPTLEDHLRRFVGPESDAHHFLGATGLRLRPSNFWVILGDCTPASRPDVGALPQPAHFAATMFASTGTSTKEIISRGGWKSVAMVVRYEHASEERNGLLAQSLNQLAESSNVVQIANALPEDGARSAHDDPEVEGEVLDLT